jgi:hypothetical protein
MDHFHGCDFNAVGFKAFDDFADDVFFYTVRLDNG